MEVVLHAEPCKDTDRPIVHVDRKIHGEYALDVAQDRTCALIEIEKFSGPIKLTLGGYERIRNLPCRAGDAPDF